ncbi:nickel-dependent hydrogenase large subunit [bacterium]|nr:nickel-dependent hydrogenase large subunit [bacterium]
MATVVLDPVTRIEGHLRVETEVSGGRVTSAWSTSPLFRGIEPILKNRDPRDAWMITQRLCGVCTYVHGVTSIRSVENSLRITIPDNARIIRNLLMGAQFVHDHLVNFYQLHLLDWVDVVSALSADPAKAVTVDNQINSSRNRTTSYFNGVKQQLASFAQSGQLGPFNNGYWGHPAYILTPEENLVFMANYLEALKNQIQVAHMHAIYGGKNPHPQTMIVGGVTLNKDLTSTRITEFRSHVTAAQSFVTTYYLPDTTYLLNRYKEYANIGPAENLMSFGEFPQSSSEPSSLFFPRGAIFNRATTSVQPVDVNNISEHITHSWYSGNDSANPAQGETVPSYSGLNTSGQYSWIKAPRYQGQPMEVGPLARVMVNYGKGHSATKTQVDSFLRKLGLSLPAMYSSLGRTAARAIETKVIVDAMVTWAGQVKATTPSTSAMPNRKTFSMASSGSGVGLNEAPRGALGHWVNYSSQKITNYQMVVPSTWNFGPRDANDVPGPVEHSLTGVPVADEARPLEVLRVVHSFNPCIACAVHVFDPEKKAAFEVKAQ